MKVVVVIPARLGSSRLPRKVILDICGKPMVQHVYELAKQAKNIDEVYIATDSTEVEKICKNFTSNVIMTSKKHESGTDRIAEAIERISCDYVINVQGDEPLMDSELIDSLAFTLKKEKVTMISAMHKIETSKELKTPNSVKVTTDINGFALYFSRAIIPFNRDAIEEILSADKLLPEYKFYKHIGIYGYSTDFLLEYANLEQTPLELSEKLEQLRVLENGHKIKMLETDYKPIGVDTEEDLIRVRKILK